MLLHLMLTLAAAQQPDDVAARAHRGNELEDRRERAVREFERHELGASLRLQEFTRSQFGLKTS